MISYSELGLATYFIMHLISSTHHMSSPHDRWEIPHKIYNAYTNWILWVISGSLKDIWYRNVSHCHKLSQSESPKDKYLYHCKCQKGVTAMLVRIAVVRVTILSNRPMSESWGWCRPCRPPTPHPGFMMIDALFLAITMSHSCLPEWYMLILPLTGPLGTMDVLLNKTVPCHHVHLGE